MIDRTEERPEPVTFDINRFAEDTLFHDRREGRDRRDGRPTSGPQPRAEAPARIPGERRAKKERRRRIDPTTFEKQYTDDELEFMNAMQRFKVQSGKPFPSFGDVLRVAHELGYRQTTADDESAEFHDQYDLDESDSYELVRPTDSR